MNEYDKYFTKSIKVEQTGSVYPTTIQPSSIDSNQLRNVSITNDKIALGAVTASSIASQTITSDNIATGTITATNIQAGSITANEIQTGAITATKISSDAVIAGKIAAGAINASNIIVDGIVTADKITVTNLSSIKADLGTITAGSISGVTITLPKSDETGANATGRLKWGNDNNKIWVDGTNTMGIRANSGTIYFYGGTSEIAVLIRGAQAKFPYGIQTNGNLNVTGDMGLGGYLTMNGFLTVNAQSSFRGIMYMNTYRIVDIGGLKFSDIDPGTTNTLYRYGSELLRYRDNEGVVWNISKTVA